MSECVYVSTQEPNKYRCAFCGHERESRHTPELLHRKCPSRREDERRLRRAVEALMDGGIGTRAKKEALRLLAICEGCEQFREDLCTADKLCPMRARAALVLRLVSAKAACPLGHYG